MLICDPCIEFLDNMQPRFVSRGGRQKRQDEIVVLKRIGVLRNDLAKAVLCCRGLAGPGPEVDRALTPGGGVGPAFLEGGRAAQANRQVRRVHQPVLLIRLLAMTHKTPRHPVA